MEFVKNKTLKAIIMKSVKCLLVVLYRLEALLPVLWQSN